MALNVNLAWGAETLVETVGFESSEGYTSSTTYNSSDYTTGTSGSKWTINYGAFATSGAIVGSQSAQFRVYSAGNYGQLRNTVAYESDITKVVFNTKVSNKNSSIKVSCSADGISWTDIETVSFSGTTMVEHTSTISASGARYIQFTAAGSKPSSSNYQIYIDAVKIYTTGGVTYTEVLFQQAGTPAHPDRHCVVIPFMQNCPQARRLRPQYSFQQAGTPEYIGRFPLWCGLETAPPLFPAPCPPLPKGRGSLAAHPSIGVALHIVLLFIVCQRSFALRAPPNFPLSQQAGTPAHPDGFLFGSLMVHIVLTDTKKQQAELTAYRIGIILL